jgi:uncharacterized protein (TIGR00290 family)
LDWVGDTRVADALKMEGTLVVSRGIEALTSKSSPRLSLLKSMPPSQVKSTTPIVLASSGGKDSLLALAALRAADYDVRALVSTFTPDGLLAMHRVSRALVESQAASLRLPLVAMEIESDPTNARYEAVFGATMAPFIAQGIRHVAFGDLFLQDIRDYRDAMLARLGLTGVYPIWGRDTTALAQSFIAEGYRALTVCVDTDALDAAFVGRAIDAQFLASLPSAVDPCGERGEFHTFVVDAPGLAFEVPVSGGLIEQRGRFAYAMLRPGNAESCARCGALFTCGATKPDERCWCVDEPKRAIDPAYATCLCPRCLRERSVI